MSDKKAIRGGCFRGVVVVMGLVWFITGPIWLVSVVKAAVAGLVGEQAVSGIAMFVAGLGSTVPFLVLTSLARRREPGGAIASLGGGLAAASGYLLLDATIRTLVPQRETLVPLGSRYGMAGVRVALLAPYAVLAAATVPRLAGLPARRLRDWLGLGRPRWPTCLLALAAAALVTVPWPITGALGDSLSTLAASVEVLSFIVPHVLVFWGLIFVMLTASFPRTELAGVTTALVAALAGVGAALPGDRLVEVSRIPFLLPLALLLTEMRARSRNALPLLALACCYRLGPLLFVDPRDAVASGIPELQHVLSYLAVMVGATVLTAVLWMGRRMLERRRRMRGRTGSGPRPVPPMPMALVALAAWGLWTGIYLAAGEPGFFNHGFLIVLDEQADLASVSYVESREARIQAVYEELVQTSEKSQRPICGELDEMGIPYRRYYVMNMIRVDGHRWLMDRFEARQGVARVILNPNVRRYPRRMPFPYGAGEVSDELQGNLAAVRADAAWALGVLGEGIVVAGQDTGYDWDHPALKGRYRGWDGREADHDYNWHDAWDGTRVPFDDGSHGTHTLGTVLGDDGRENRIGVAPRAQWIGCRNMRRGLGNPGSYAECMEFFLAPYPLDGDPFRDGEVGRAPHVINNSWGCPRMEGCFPDTLRPAVEALRAAGIMMVVSAGNEGPGCSTATTAPANYDASFSVGATTDAGDVVGFSSRGPADGLIKPDISAPGQQVRSSVPDGGYGTASGTSMAAPHVAGVVALVWAADETLVGDIDATEVLLCETALAKPVSRTCAQVSVPEGPLAAATTPPACACGGVSGVPNNVYGCGIVDAEAAVERALGR